MIRFRNIAGTDAIQLHNRVLQARGKVAWGLWLKDVENRQSISDQLAALGSDLTQIYVADTSEKSNPTLYVATVSRVVLDPLAVDIDIVPDYYKDRVIEVPIWFELTSPLIRIDADQRYMDVLGVPTIYFLEYDNGKLVNIEPQREFDKINYRKAKILLHLTDIHLGEDHGFRQPGPKPRTDISPQRSLAEVLREDLDRVGALEKIAGIIISGDIVTKGGWQQVYRFGNSEVSGLQAASFFLEDLSEVLDVAPEWFFAVPGNHDVVREAGADPSALKDYLIDYKHESGFRTIREDFCGIYKLSPLNHVIKMEIDGAKVLLGMLNSAYLNDKVSFNEYGFVGDDAEHVFKIMEKNEDFVKVVVLHHHVLPVYDREVVGDGQNISLTLDAARIMRRAQEVGACLVLHGHQHSTKLFNFASWTPEMEKELRVFKKAIRVLAGGSVGVKEDRIPSGESNTYALLDFSKTKPSVRIRRIYPNGRLGDDW